MRVTCDSSASSASHGPGKAKPRLQTSHQPFLSIIIINIIIIIIIIININIINSIIIIIITKVLDIITQQR